MPFNVEDPIAVLLATTRAFRSAGIEAAAYGGLALAAYGAARETKDADLAVVNVDAARAEHALVSAGLDVKLAFDQVRFGGLSITRFTLFGEPDVGGLNTIDLVAPRPTDFGRDALARSYEGTLRTESLLILRPEDFVLFKLLSTRERDLEDITSVLVALRGRIDLRAIEEQVAAFGRELTDHDVTARWARTVAAER